MTIGAAVAVARASTHLVALRTLPVTAMIIAATIGAHPGLFVVGVHLQHGDRPATRTEQIDAVLDACTVAGFRPNVVVQSVDYAAAQGIVIALENYARTPGGTLPGSSGSWPRAETRRGCRFFAEAEPREQPAVRRVSRGQR